MRAQNLRAPEFNETAGGFRVTLFNTPLMAVSRRQAAPEKDDALTLNPRQEIALGYLNNPDNTRITNSDLQNLCPEVHPETIRRDLADLVARHILVKRGKKRGSYYMLPNADGLDPDDNSE
jgi:ATP-dependent DNA helicase RecG